MSSLLAVAGEASGELEEEAREARLFLFRELRAGMPKILVNTGMIALVWLFTRYVFIPLSMEYAALGIPLPQIISLAMMAAIALLALEIFREVLRLIDAAVTCLAYRLALRHACSTLMEAEDYRVGVRGVVRVGLAAGLLALFKDLLNVLHPAVAAAAILATAVWAAITLLRSAKPLLRVAERCVSDVLGRGREERQS